MCENDSAERFPIDQGLYESARYIEHQLEGERASDMAWDVFFGRSGGAVIWSHFQRVKKSYVKASALAMLSPRGSRPTGKLRCENVGASSAKPL
jgi:hypothetical protein